MSPSEDKAWKLLRNRASNVGVAPECPVLKRLLRRLLFRMASEVANVN
jgi:hypothetical protein